ncbi:MAG: thermonuclease family protein [Magnetococcales bacterium]|nr:thermonuclease family protein [Magnetococcales bacterium]
MKHRIFLHLFTKFLLIGCSCIPWPAWAESWQGQVIRVMDGDSLVVDRGDGRQIKVRVAEIDAPEHGQPFADVARRHAEQLVGKRMVRIREKERDRYDRVVGWVSRSGLEDFGKEMVRVGLAWRHVRYGKDPELTRLEREARQRKIGLWSEPHPTPPWAWKRTHPNDHRE